MPPTQDNACRTSATSRTISRPIPHPIHTFQRPQFRSTQTQPRTSSIFGRTRSRKSVIKEVEENLTHPAVIVILSVINFCLWMFLFCVKVGRYTGVTAIWIWLRLVYIFEFLVKIFCRLFNLDPEKTNQGSDYTHIEGKSTFVRAAVKKK